MKREYNTFCKEGPFHVGFPITNKCNLKCKMCLRTKNLRNNKLLSEKDLSIKDVEKILKNLNTSVKSINISAGYGEIFLHPKVIQIVKKIHKYDCMKTSLKIY